MSTQKEVKILVKTNGDLQCLYTDTINLHNLGCGKLNIERASKVEFNDDLQMWTVRLVATGKIIGKFDKRIDALAYEVKYLNNTLA